MKALHQVSIPITFLIFFIITLHGHFESDECNIHTDLWIQNEVSAYCTLDEQLTFDGTHENTQFCDIDIINSNISPSEFKNKYWNKKPVLINTKLSEWSNQTFWKISNILRLFPKYKFQAGRSSKLPRYSKGETTMTLEQYIDYINNSINISNEEPMYIFDRDIFGLNISLFANNIQLPQYIGYPLLDYKNYFDVSAASIYGIFLFGPENTGTSFHVHDTAIVGLAAGRKRWLIYPPSLSPIGGLWQGYSAIDWYNTYLNILKNVNVNINSFSVHNYSNVINKLQEYDYKIKIDRNKGLKKEIENLFSAKIKNINDIFCNINTLSKYYLYKPLECIQNKGQLLYLPEGWLHLVINLEDVIGVSIQKILNYRVLDKYPPTGSTNMFIQANELLQQNNLWSAETFYLKSILMDPTFIEPYIALARLYLDYLNDYFIAERLARIGYILNNKHEETISLLRKIVIKQHKRHLLYYIDNNLPLP